MAMKTIDPASQDPAHDEAEHRRAPSGKIVHEAVYREGEEELARPNSALFFSALAAGLSMGFSLIAQGLLRAALPDAYWRPLVVKLGYPIGFLIVVLGRQQLFTENTLKPVLPLLKRRDAKTLGQLLQLWGVVLAGNLLGALAMGWAVTTSAFDPSARDAFGGIGAEAMAHGFGMTLWRAVFGGWLIALLVWLLPFAETGRVAVIVVITYLVGLGHFSHIVAGAVEVFALAWEGQRSWGEVVRRYIVPTVLGNTIGGVTLVAALNHAQVVAGQKEES